MKPKPINLPRTYWSLKVDPVNMMNEMRSGLSWEEALKEGERVRTHGNVAYPHWILVEDAVWLFYDWAGNPYNRAHRQFTGGERYEYVKLHVDTQTGNLYHQPRGAEFQVCGHVCPASDAFKALFADPEKRKLLGAGELEVGDWCASFQAAIIARKAQTAAGNKEQQQKPENNNEEQPAKELKAKKPKAGGKKKKQAKPENNNEEQPAGGSQDAEPMEVEQELAAAAIPLPEMEDASGANVEMDIGDAAGLDDHPEDPPVIDDPAIAQLSDDVLPIEEVPADPTHGGQEEENAAEAWSLPDESLAEDEAEEMEVAVEPTLEPPPAAANLSLEQVSVCDSSATGSEIAEVGGEKTPADVGVPPRQFPVFVLSESPDVTSPVLFEDSPGGRISETPRSIGREASPGRRLSFTNEPPLSPLNLDPQEDEDEEEKEQLLELKNMATSNATENPIDTTVTPIDGADKPIDGADKPIDGAAKLIDGVFVSEQDKAAYQAWLDGFFFPMQKKLNDDFGGFLFGRLAEQKKDFDERMRVKNGEVQYWKDQFTEVKGDLLKTQGDLATKTTAFENMEKDKNELVDELQQEKSKLTQKDQELEALGLAKSAVDLELRQTTEVVVAKESTITGLNTQVSNLKATIEKKTTENAGLTKKRDQFMRDSKKHENKFNVTSGKLVNTIDYAKQLCKILNRVDIKLIIEANKIEMPDDPNVIVLSPSPEAPVGSSASTSSVGLDDVFPVEDVKKNLDGEYY